MLKKEPEIWCSWTLLRRGGGKVRCGEKMESGLMRPGCIGPGSLWTWLLH